MSNQIRESAKAKRAIAEANILAIQADIASLELKAAESWRELEKWDFFLAQLEELSRSIGAERFLIAKHPDEPEKIVLRANSLPAHLAERLRIEPGNQMRGIDLADDLQSRGIVDSPNYRNVVYTTLVRRGDVFEKTGAGLFRLIADFEIKGDVDVK